MPLEKIVPEYYSKNTLVKNLFFKRLECAIQLAFVKLKSDNSLKAADFGCGDGTFLRLLEKKFPSLNTFGIDVLPEVAEIKKFLRAEIKIADLINSGFPDNFFDLVFCLDTLEHFENLEPPVKEIRRVLKNDGLLILSMPTENFFYKLGRLFLKGTTSSIKGPCSSPHFHDARKIEKFLCYNDFETVKRISLPRMPFLTLFNVISLKKKIPE